MPPPTPALSKRQTECLRCLLTGASNKEIAQWLGLAPNSIDVYMRKLRQKLDLDNRTKLALYAQRIGLTEWTR